MGWILRVCNMHHNGDQKSLARIAMILRVMLLTKKSTMWNVWGPFGLFLEDLKSVHST